jgi:hypothetical protein
MDGAPTAITLFVDDVFQPQPSLMVGLKAWPLNALSEEEIMPAFGCPLDDPELEAWLMRSVEHVFGSLLKSGGGQP